MNILKTALIILAISTVLSFGVDKNENLDREKAFIKTVIDGDTVKLGDGRMVRLIGLDAPETHHPTLPPQRFGAEASAYLKKLAENKNCELEFEEGNKIDKHGRTVAYLYVNGLLLNAELLKNGFAYVYTKYLFRLKDDFIKYQMEAIKSRKGLWNIKDKSGAKLVNK